MAILIGGKVDNQSTVKQNVDSCRVGSRLHHTRVGALRACAESTHCGKIA